MDSTHEYASQIRTHFKVFPKLRVFSWLAGQTDVAESNVVSSFLNTLNEPLYDWDRNYITNVLRIGKVLKSHARDFVAHYCRATTVPWIYGSINLYRQKLGCTISTLETTPFVTEILSPPANKKLAPPLELSASLCQLGSLDEYCNEFHARAVHIPGLFLDIQLGLFLNELQETIRVRFQPNDAIDLRTAMRVARSITREYFAHPEKSLASPIRSGKRWSMGFELGFPDPQYLGKTYSSITLRITNNSNSFLDKRNVTKLQKVHSFPELFIFDNQDSQITFMPNCLHLCFIFDGRTMLSYKNKRMISHNMCICQDSPTRNNKSCRHFAELPTNEHRISINLIF
ncbi:leucine ABC transporter subunit substrate-binding protein LivK [Striga asiatica]|uniref:Leucine ABC transporter subunit substrate-binding protein LivK n=1 Tax=Striga asiatica TaxID=4170 RepID=A0A5A7R1T6_STRAF|nr:leucine ABC transporter subunit substrate-binding protein LivK [Striga asiatica]